MTTNNVTPLSDARKITDREIAEWLKCQTEGDRLINAFDLEQELIDSFKKTDAPISQHTPFRKLDGLLEFRPGELTIWAGFGGHRKSMLLNQFALWWMRMGERVCIASMEMPLDLTYHRLGVQASRTENPVESYLREFSMWAGRFLWFYDQQGVVPPERIVRLVRYWGAALGGRHIIVDSIMKLVPEGDDYAAQERLMHTLTAAARSSGSHVHLVHHLRKADEDKIPGSQDIKGSGNIRDQADNVIIVWQDKKLQQDPVQNQLDPDNPTARFVVNKQRNGAFEGKAALWFHAKSYHHLGHPHDVPFEWRTDLTAPPPREPGSDDE